MRLWAAGRFWDGTSFDLLPPKWFTKDPTATLDQEVAEMLRVIRRA